MSSLTWLAYSEAERKRTLEVIQMLGEPGTLDELGIGRIRDALSDTLFPGTSTIQTRARYFLFIPWIYLGLERSSPVKDANRRARNAELRLIESLARGAGDASGVIGRNARTGLVQLPSAIYWQGLRSWGIRRYPGEKRSYHRLLRFGDLRHPLVDDDGELLPGAAASNWDPYLPPAPPGLLEEAGMDLGAHEAEYLRDRITVEHGRSALAEILLSPVPLPSTDFPWQLASETRQRLSAHNFEYLEQAELFSLAIHGAALLYNHLLATEAGRERRERQYRSGFGEWAAEVETHRDRLAAWHDELGRLWEIVHAANPRAPGPAERSFVEAWSALALAGDPSRLLEDDRARNLIADRELELKRSNSRLRNRSALESWGGSSGSDRLSFRWQITKTLLADIRQGLSSETAAASEEPAGA